MMSQAPNFFSINSERFSRSEQGRLLYNSNPVQVNQVITVDTSGSGQPQHGVARLKSVTCSSFIAKEESAVIGEEITSQPLCRQEGYMRSVNLRLIHTPLDTEDLQ